MLQTNINIINFLDFAFNVVNFLDFAFNIIDFLDFAFNEIVTRIGNQMDLYREV